MPSALRLRAYYFLVFGALGLYLPFFPSWLQARGLVGASMSALVSLVPLLGLFSPPLVGMLADHLGVRGGMMTLTGVLTSLGATTLTVAAALLSPLPFLAALVSMVLFAAFRAPMVGLADTLAMEHAGDYGRVRLFGSLGFLTAASLGGQVIDLSHPFQLPLLIAGLLWLCTAFSLALPRTAKTARRPALEDARALLQQDTFRWLLFAVLCGFLSHTAYDLCASLRLLELGADAAFVGTFWALGTVAEVALLYRGQATLQRWGPSRMLALAFFAHAIRWLCFSRLTDPRWLLALQPLHALTFALMWLALVALLKREVGQRGMATGQGIFATGSAVGNTAGYWLWGLLYERWGTEVVFLAAAGTAALAILVALRLWVLEAHHELTLSRNVPRS